MMIIYRNSKIKRMDTFRELLSLWEERGYCELRETDSPFCWANEIGDILLYDYPLIEMLPKEWKHGLFSNQQAQCDKCQSWIFWARHPRMLETKIAEGIRSFEEREHESIFLGKIENETQKNNRQTHDWSTAITFFSMPILMGNTTTYPYTQEEYLDYVSKSKFGLCLPGYGPKCNREIEYLGLGTVPIYTDGCDNTFHNQLKEGVHYLTAKTPEELKETVINITKEEWELLSQNCIKWYNENASPEGSFEVTKNLVTRSVHDE